MISDSTRHELVAFEDAIKKTSFGKFNFILMTLAGGLMTCAFIELTSVTFILPIAQCDLNLTSGDKGILSAIGYVGVILSSFLWGFLADTTGRKKTLVPTLLVAFAATVASSLANSFWLLVLLRFVNGFFISCASSTTFAYLGEFHDQKNRGRVLMISSLLYASMNVLLPTFAILTLNQEWSFYIDFLGVNFKPWRLFLLICGVPNLICALLLIFVIPESPKFKFAQGDEPGTLEILQKMYNMNTGKHCSTYEVKSLIKDEEFDDNERKKEHFFKFMWTQSVPLFKGHHLKNILTACFINFSVCNTSNGFWTFLTEILNKISLWIDASNEPATVCEIFHKSTVTRNQTQDVSICLQKLELSTFINVYEIAIGYAICYGIMSVLINRTGKLSLLLVVTITCGMSAALLMFVSIPWTLSYIYMYMILAGLGISIVNASTVELFPTKMRAMAICISMMVGRLGSTVGSVVIGFFIDKYCTWTFLMPTFLLFASAILACTIPNISKRQK